MKWLEIILNACNPLVHALHLSDTLAIKSCKLLVDPTIDLFISGLCKKGVHLLPELVT